MTRTRQDALSTLIDCARRDTLEGVKRLPSRDLVAAAGQLGDEHRSRLEAMCWRALPDPFAIRLGRILNSDPEVWPVVARLVITIKRQDAMTGADKAAAERHFYGTVPKVVHPDATWLRVRCDMRLTHLYLRSRRTRYAPTHLAAIKMGALMAPNIDRLFWWLVQADAPAIARDIYREQGRCEGAAREALDLAEMSFATDHQAFLEDDGWLSALPTWGDWASDLGAIWSCDGERAIGGDSLYELVTADIMPRDAVEVAA